MKLMPIAGTELTAYVIQLLLNRGIKTIRDFLDSDVLQIANSLNLQLHMVCAIKRELIRHYGPQRILLSQLIEKQAHHCSYLTDIKGLDDLFVGKCFTSGSILEVCSYPFIGKTQLCYTIALNHIIRYGAEVLYIDSKCDFSARRVHQLLQKRNIDKTKIAQIMCLLKIHHAFTVEAIIQILQKLLVHFERESLEARNIKLIIIDCLPPVLIMCDRKDRFQGQILLSKLSKLLHKLASKHSMTFLLANTLMRSKNAQCVNEENDCEDNINYLEASQQFEQSKNRQIAIPLGYFWKSVPDIRLSLEMPVQPETVNDSSVRLVKIIKSCYTQPKSSYLRITDIGVI